jgi:release factor glutamine methyltransferase
MEFSRGGLELSVPDSVYRPSDDSFMLAGAAEGLRGDVLEIGCGSGIVSLTAAKTAKSVLGTDVSPDAVACAAANAARNGIANAKFAISDMFSAIPHGTAFDAILFNPPYLPTEESERIHGPLNQAFDGGKDGRGVLDRFLAQFGSFLRPGGILLVVQSSLNDPEKTRSVLEGMGYAVETVAEEAFFFERLCVLRAQKRQ